MAATDLITLAEARDSIRLPAGDTTRDATILTLYIPAVTPIVEDVVGPVVARTVTTTVLTSGTNGAILLPSAVTAVTSITADGVAVLSTAYTVNKRAGIIESVSGAPLALTGKDAVVVFTSGIAADTAAVPPAIKLAARLIFAQLWQADQQGYRPDFNAPDMGSSQTPSGFAIPRRAYALLEPFSAGSFPGIA